MAYKKCKVMNVFLTMLSGFSSDSDLISLTVDVDSLAELDDGMASNQSSPSRAVGSSLTSEPPVQSTVASEQEWTKPEGEKESHSLFPGSLKPKSGKQDYLEKAGELIKLALKKEEEEDYESAFSFYRKGVDLLLEGVQGMDLPVKLPYLWLGAFDYGISLVTSAYCVAKR